VATRELYQARQEEEALSREWQQATGVFRTRKEQVKIRKDKAIEGQRRLEEELRRLEYTLQAGFGITLGQQTLGARPGAPEGGRVTFIQKTTPTDLRRRMKEIRAKLNEAPG